MSAAGISTYSEAVLDREPHLTIADYSDVPLAEITSFFERFYQGKPKFNITFSVLGTFIESGTLILKPTLAKELIDFHAHHHQYFGPFKKWLNNIS